jgi:hypothetical protein
MRGRRMMIGLFAVGATFGSVSACSRNNQAAGDISPADVVSVQVRNENFLDMDVYVVSQGLATRLGTVTGNGTRHFVLDRSVSSQDFSVVATPIGGNGRASSGALRIGPGQTVDFTIGSLLNNSSVLVRQ